MDTPHARLRRARTLAGLSQRELARLACLASTHVGLIESGHVGSPQTDTLCALARVLGCSLDWLLAGEGDAPTPEQILAAVERARAEHAARAIAHTASDFAVSDDERPTLTPDPSTPDARAA